MKFCCREVIGLLSPGNSMMKNLGTVIFEDDCIAIGIDQENGILLSAGYSLRIWYP